MLTYLVFILAPRLFHVHRLSLCTSKTHGFKKLLTAGCKFYFFFFLGEMAIKR